MISDINYTAYNLNAKKYIDHNLDGTTGGLTPFERVTKFKLYLKSGRVFELGSGGGMDAQALKSLGFDVIASDFVPSFVNMLKELGFTTLQFDAKKDSIPDDLLPLDGVYANAVFVHFSPKDFKDALLRIHRSLKDNGYLFFSVIFGKGTEVSGRAKGIEREFYYYDEKDIEEILTETGFTIDELKSPIDGKWIHAICHK